MSILLGEHFKNNNKLHFQFSIALLIPLPNFNVKSVLLFTFPFPLKILKFLQIGFWQDQIPSVHAA